MTGEPDRSCPICTRTSYDPALIKEICKSHKRIYRVTKCKDCGEIVLSEYNQLCVTCMFATPRRHGFIGNIPRSKKRQGGRPSYTKRPFILDVEGDNATEHE